MKIPDQQFSNPRLAKVYDALDGERDDLDTYLGLVDEFAPASVLDIGCGTGSLLHKLSGKGLRLVGVDPADASLSIAKLKAGGSDVQWVLGSTESIPAGNFDIAFMTGNVAQYFLSDADWDGSLINIRSSLAPTGVFCFETRNPNARSWERWNSEDTYQRIALAEIGTVETWCEVTDVSLPLVSFQWTYVFASDGAVLTSKSTLIFRQQEEIEASLSKAGFKILDILDVPDRPAERVFIAGLQSEN